MDQPLVQESEVRIELPEATLEGSLCLPAGARGIVIFAHGSGSSRLSPRNRYVAGVLQNQGIATLLFDLLTFREEAIDERTLALRFDIDFLAQRLIAVTRWVTRRTDCRALNPGYFGASTGAAAALVAAAALSKTIAAVVSRGGRPDLAGEALDRVIAPALLIVGGDDYPVIEMNRAALARLQSEKSLVIVPGATHLFEEPGALAEVARLAAGWFGKYLK
jgi:putative phosphoribosyl transferase